MLLAKLLVFLLFQVLTVLGLSGNALINLPQLDEELINWPQQKIQTIEYLLKTLTEVGNVTLVGWQQIWNSDGTLKEIKTIELTILTPLSSVNILKEEEMGIEPEILSTVRVPNEIFASTGILVSGSIGQWARDATILKILETQEPSYLKTYYSSFGQLLYWQQNATVTSPIPIQNLVKNLQQQSVLSVGVLQYNPDDTLNLQSSNIVPELLSIVLEAENATLPMIESSLAGLTKGYHLVNNQIPKYVANYMKQTIPGYTWVVGQEMDSFSVNADVYLKVQYIWIDLDEVFVPYDIVGIKI